MNLSSIKESGLINLELLAKQVVEGFITGMHKSPFHGFSVEFSEHKPYNKGDSTRHVDWKLFAKTSKLYTKKYEEETNLRCHIIIDNSSSMHYPSRKNKSIDKLNKIGFASVASACLLEILKRQRDAVGLSVYSDTYEYYAPEKGSEKHRYHMLKKLEELLQQEAIRGTDTFKFLHEIADKIHRRSLIFLFTDMFQAHTQSNELFEALRHLKHNKHEVVLFHVVDAETELNFSFDNSPKKLVDVETGEEIQLYTQNYKEVYKKHMDSFVKRLKNKCLQYKIDFVSADIQQGFYNILQQYLISRKKIL